MMLTLVVMDDDGDVTMVIMMFFSCDDFGDQSNVGVDGGVGGE